MADEPTVLDKLKANLAEAFLTGSVIDDATAKTIAMTHFSKPSELMDAFIKTGAIPDNPLSDDGERLYNEVTVVLSHPFNTPEDAYELSKLRQYFINNQFGRESVRGWDQLGL